MRKTLHVRDIRVQAGERIRNRRLKLGFRSQAALAREAGLGPRTVAAAETGAKVGANTKLHLERALQWSEGGIDALLNGDEPTPLDEPEPEPARPSYEELTQMADSLARQVEELQEMLRRKSDSA